MLGAASLFLSLFLTWSHQFSSGFLAQYDHSTALQGVPHDPTAWQLYSLADVLLALLAGALLLGASVGGRALRTGLVVAAGIALAFVIHAMGVPPTNGANIFDPVTGHYAANAPRSGTGEVVAVVGLGLALVGLGVSFTAD